MPTTRLVDGGIDPELFDEIASLVSNDLDLVTDVTLDLIFGLVRRYEQLNGLPALVGRALPGETRGTSAKSVGVGQWIAYGDRTVLIHISPQDVRQTS